MKDPRKGISHPESASGEGHDLIEGVAVVVQQQG
jgi:hypothetical protein